MGFGFGNWNDHLDVYLFTGAKQTRMAGQERWCVVTGGRGFAARHLVDMLIRYEMFSVRIADLGPSIKLDPHEEEGTLGEALRSGRAQYVSADLRDKAQVFKGFLATKILLYSVFYINRLVSFRPLL